ncbi:MAG: cation transporter [Caulobacteraceae bacterium]
MTDEPGHLDPAYRTALLISAGLNLVMFLVEGGVGLTVGSAALIADAVDFLEDTAGYSLAALAIGWSVRNRAWAGVAQAVAMGLVGVAAVGEIVRRLAEGGAPSSRAVGATALLALAINGFCAWRLVRFRSGDASMRSIWLSTRNDALLNGLTIAAAGLIYITKSAWPDIAVGAVIAAINLWSSFEVLLAARRELREGRAPGA